MKSLKHIKRYKVNIAITSLKVSMLFAKFDSRGLDHYKRHIIAIEVII